MKMRLPQSQVLNCIFSPKLFFTFRFWTFRFVQISISEKSFEKKMKLTIMDKLQRAVDNPDNEKIKNSTFQELKREKNEILQQLPVSGEMVKYFHEKLEQYRFCSDTEDIRPGNYIRWIPLDKDPIDLDKRTVRVINVIETKDENIYVKCTINNHYYLNIDFSKCLIFQKLSEQEELILNVIQYYMND